MPTKIEKPYLKSTQYFINFFAMFITVLSFILLSLQIIFISIIGVFSNFINHLSDKFFSPAPANGHGPTKSSCG